MPKKRLFIGTSGWIYSDWEEIFYPKNLSSKGKLKYFSQHFKTVEINYSFYHLPRESTYKNWYKQVPNDFLFAVKASRFITHIKRLKGVKAAWKTFLENTLNLKKKLGPILFQFPPSFKATPENIKRLENFFKLITKNGRLKYAFEFRHKTWCSEKIYKLLKKYNAAWVIACPPIGWSLKATGRRADSPCYPRVEAVTCNFAYIRMHGSKVLFSSKYTDKELKDLAQKIKKWRKSGDVYVYFNNDVQGFAIENAKELLELCKAILRK